MRPAGRGELDSLYFDYPQFAPPQRPAVETERPVIIVGQGPWAGCACAARITRGAT